MYKKSCSFDTSAEEEKAFLIWGVINRFNNKGKDYYSPDFDRKILDNLNFEILSTSQMSNKNHLIGISLKYHSIDLNKLHLHLMTFGINKEFVDKTSTTDSELEKKYLTVWV
jgi:hypothetical protein